jgi:membrane protein
VGIAASIVLAQHASATAQSLAPLAIVVSKLQAISGFLVSWMLAFVMFKLIPDTYVKWRSAFFGSLVAAVLWEIGKWGFGLYVGVSVHRGSWYGSLALIPLFMLWIYLTWTFILLGLHVAYAHQYYPMLKRQYFYMRDRAVPISDIRWVLSLGILLYRRFRAGRTMEPHDAAEELLLPTDITAELLEGLQAAGLVHKTKSDAYALARPPELITAHDLLSAARALCQMPPELAKDHPHMRVAGSSAALDALDALETRWAKSHTLPALAGDNAPSKIDAKV